MEWMVVGYSLFSLSFGPGNNRKISPKRYNAIYVKWYPQTRCMSKHALCQFLTSNSAFWKNLSSGTVTKTTKRTWFMLLKNAIRIVNASKNSETDDWDDQKGWRSTRKMEEMEQIWCAPKGEVDNDKLYVNFKDFQILNLNFKELYCFEQELMQY